MADRPCAVERALAVMLPSEYELVAEILQDNTLTAGTVADILREGGYNVDRMAVGHFRRKLRFGKATLELG